MAKKKRNDESTKKQKASIAQALSSESLPSELLDSDEERPP